MEHTKGELKIVPNYRGHKVLLKTKSSDFINPITKERQSIAAITDDIHGELELREANAKHLVLCWNSHDELQAKADSHDTLLAACENALVTIRIMSIPCKDDSVANNNELLSIMANSFEQAIAEAKRT